MADPRTLIEAAEDSTPDRVHGAPRYRTSNGVANFLRACEGEGEIYVRLDVVQALADSLDARLAVLESDLDSKAENKSDEILAEVRPVIRRAIVKRIGNILGDVADDTPAITGELAEEIDTITAQYGAHKAALLAASALVVEWSMNEEDLRHHRKSVAGASGRARVVEAFGERRADQLFELGEQIDFDDEDD